MKVDDLAVHLYRGGWRVYRLAARVELDAVQVDGGLGDLLDGDGDDPGPSPDGLLLIVRDGVVLPVVAKSDRLQEPSRPIETVRAEALEAGPPRTLTAPALEPAEAGTLANAEDALDPVERTMQDWARKPPRTLGDLLGRDRLQKKTENEGE